MPEPQIYNTQLLEDLEMEMEGEAILAYYDTTPHRIEVNEPPDPDGLFRSVTVTYTEDPAAPFLLRVLSLYGEVQLCAYEYVQFEGFKSIVVPDDLDIPDELRAALPLMAAYIHDLLMFHRIDPDSCVYTPSPRKA